MSGGGLQRCDGPVTVNVGVAGDLDGGIVGGVGIAVIQLVIAGGRIGIVYGGVAVSIPTVEGVQKASVVIVERGAGDIFRIVDIPGTHLYALCGSGLGRSAGRQAGVSAVGVVDPPLIGDRHRLTFILNRHMAHDSVGAGRIQAVLYGAVGCDADIEGISFAGFGSAPFAGHRNTFHLPIRVAELRQLIVTEGNPGTAGDLGFCLTRGNCGCQCQRRKAGIYRGGGGGRRSKIALQHLLQLELEGHGGGLRNAGLGDGFVDQHLTGLHFLDQKTVHMNVFALEGTLLAAHAGVVVVVVTAHDGNPLDLILGITIDGAVDGHAAKVLKRGCRVAMRVGGDILGDNTLIGDIPDACLGVHGAPTGALLDTGNGIGTIPVTGTAGGTIVVDITSVGVGDVAGGSQEEVDGQGLAGFCFNSKNLLGQ